MDFLLVKHRLVGVFIGFIFIYTCTLYYFEWTSYIRRVAIRSSNTTTIAQIIIITPTKLRAERLADLTRFSQTLMHIQNLHWIVVEDANVTNANVRALLVRSKIDHTYLAYESAPNTTGKGWVQRNVALCHLRRIYRNKTNHRQLFNRRRIVYFADDDNSYDIRLFDKYIRNVKKIGIWAVGLVGRAYVESPKLSPINGSVIGWNVVYMRLRKFATDMAGFALNLDLILNSKAVFGKFCKRQKSPETCFLEQLHISLNDLEAFGFDNGESDADPKQVLVWHTKTTRRAYEGSKHGYTNIE